MVMRGSVLPSAVGLSSLTVLKLSGPSARAVPARARVTSPARARVRRTAFLLVDGEAREVAARRLVFDVPEGVHAADPHDVAPPWEFRIDRQRPRRLALRGQIGRTGARGRRGETPVGTQEATSPAGQPSPDGDADDAQRGH